VTDKHANPAPAAGIGFREFLLLVSALMACQALAIDAMLPALTTIARSLGLANTSDAQLVVFTYVIGMAVGQLGWGVLSDRYGRRRVLLAGLGTYAVAAIACGLTHSFTALLVLRFLHGLAAASLVVTRSMVRDLYSGEPMARIMSLTFVVFLVSPVLAPSLGQGILLLAPWRGLFALIGGFAAVVWAWMALRLPETLHPEFRLQFDASHLRMAAAKVLGDRRANGYTLASAFVIASLLAYLGSVQQVFEQVYGRPALMPTAFAISAGTMGLASIYNARMVGRLGMRRISHTGLALLGVVAALHALVAATGHDSLWVFVLLQSLQLACVGLTVANFNTLAMEPMGEIAGLAAAVQGFISTLGAAVIAAVIGRMFDGSTLPLALGTIACFAAGLACVLWAERGRLFQARTALPPASLAELTPAPAHAPAHARAPRR
jgi:MFS transporter, DHA1 family, multidrug resistance protein